MKNLQKSLHDMAKARRRELLSYVFHVTESRVQTGPFKGMTIIPRYMWGDGDTAAKLLGIYEDELHKFIESAITQIPDIVINVGCAEGYYSIGLASRLPNTTVIAVDIDNRATKIVTDTALTNQLKNIVAITYSIDHSWLEQQCQDKINPLLVFDCEGAELELLNPTHISSLSKCSVIVECHDCMNSVITKTLISRFESTHNIEQVFQTTKDPYQFKFLYHLSDCDKWALVQEGRPSTMNWLYMIPKV